VQLVDGRAGIVCAQNPEWPLRPTVLLTHDTDGKRLEPPRLMPSGLGGHIARALEPAAPEHEPLALERAISEH
jgi:hypothetical protein